MKKVEETIEEIIEEIVSPVYWQFDLTSDGREVWCVECGRLSINRETGEPIHPAQDKVLVDILNNGFTCEFFNPQKIKR